MGQFHWDPDAYLELMGRELPDYERLQDELVDATRAVRARTILELGTGPARRRDACYLGAHPRAHLHGIDASADMLAVARTALDVRRASLAVGRLQDGLPPGPFDLVVSALVVHHLDAAAKAALFARVAEILCAGGRFVLADVVVPADAADAVTPIDPGFDLPSPVADQLRWLREAGLRPSVAWTRRDLAVLVAER